MMGINLNPLLFPIKHGVSRSAGLTFESLVFVCFWIKEHQKLQKMQLELPRRSSCRLLAKKLYEEEDVVSWPQNQTACIRIFLLTAFPKTICAVFSFPKESAGRRGEKIKQERKAQEERRRQDQDVRLTADFEVMLCYELDRKRKEDYAKFKKRG